jgi:hypothetical protein
LIASKGFYACGPVEALGDKGRWRQMDQAELDVSISRFVPVEHKEKKEGEEDAVFPYLLDSVMIEEDVSVDLRVAQEYIKGLKVSLILEESVGLLLAVRLSQSAWLVGLHISRDSNCRIAVCE